MMRALVVAAGILCATSPRAEVLVAHYTCERFVEIPVLYLDTDPKAVVVVIEGEPTYLEHVPSGSGERYAGASDRNSYVWWTKSNQAFLQWHDAATGEETFVYKNCVAQAAAPR